MIADPAGRPRLRVRGRTRRVATVLHRIMVSGARPRLREVDGRLRQSPGSRGWRCIISIGAMAWLGEELPPEQQKDATPLAPRTIKDLIEERLFEHRRDLFSELSVVFMDTTSLSFTGAGRRYTGRAGVFEGSPARPDADDPGRGHRRTGPADLLGDVAWQHRRCQRAGAGDRQVARAFRDRPRLCRGRSRHDLGRRPSPRWKSEAWNTLLGARERTDSLVRHVVLEGHTAVHAALCPARRRRGDPALRQRGDG